MRVGEGARVVQGLGYAQLWLRFTEELQRQPGRRSRSTFFFPFVNEGEKSHLLPSVFFWVLVGASEPGPHPSMVRSISPLYLESCCLCRSGKHGCASSQQVTCLCEGKCRDASLLVEVGMAPALSLGALHIAPFKLAFISGPCALSTPTSESVLK